MFGLGSATKIYIAVEGMDMRKDLMGSTGWCAIVSGRTL